MSENVELFQAERRLGTTLKDKYRLDRVLGVGGMAVVYAATHRNRRSFAIKMLHPELSVIEEIRVRFQREGYVANAVEHPGTVAVLDDDVTEDGAAFLVMELLRGASVDALAQQGGGRLSVPEALGLVYQLLDVLSAAHSKGVIHRDIKPANLFLELSGQLKVLDFGIARIRDSTSSQLATATGMTLGTPAFMAPEQALGSVGEIDARTDLWAVGATLFTLISGHLVHEGDNAQQLLIRAATRPARSLGTVLANAPRSLVELVARAVAFDKASRFGSAVEMQGEVERIAREVFGGVPSRAQLAQFAGFQVVEGEAAASLLPTEQSGPPPPPTSGSGTITAPPPSALRGTANPVSVTANGAVLKRRLPKGVLGIALGASCAVAAAVWWHLRPVAPEPDHSSAPRAVAHEGERGLRPNATATIPPVPPLAPSNEGLGREQSPNGAPSEEPSSGRPQRPLGSGGRPAGPPSRGSGGSAHSSGKGNQTGSPAPSNGAQPDNPLAMPIQ